MLKPRAISISSFERDKVLYGCPECDADFRILGSQEKFCHNCGIGIDWNVPIKLTQKISEDIEKDFIKELNNRLQKEKLGKNG